MGSNGAPKLSLALAASPGCGGWEKEKFRPRWPSCYYANDDWLFQKNNEVDRGDQGGTTTSYLVVVSNRSGTTLFEVTSHPHLVQKYLSTYLHTTY